MPLRRLCAFRVRLHSTMRDVRLNLESRIEQRLTGTRPLLTPAARDDEKDVHRRDDAVECRDVGEELRDLVVSADDADAVLVRVELLARLRPGGCDILQLETGAPRRRRHLV